VFGGLDRAVSSSKPQASACPAWRRLDTVNVIAPPVGLPRSAFFFFLANPNPSIMLVFFFFPSCVAVAEPGAPAKVNCWEAPTDIPSWKEEHIVIAVLTGWAVVIYGAKKAFGGGGKKEEAK